MKDDLMISSEVINDRARANYEALTNFFNVEEQAWQLAVYELALETLGVVPSKLLEQYPEEHCCGKFEGEYEDDHKELECECCSGVCVWCN